MDTLTTWLESGLAAQEGSGTSDAHEAEAKEAQLHKTPSRFGTWVLRRLGYKGEIGEGEPHSPPRRSHERPVHRPPGN